MKCYFCGKEASVCCPECNRNVCNKHSARLDDGRFGCFEDALGGPEGVYQEAVKRVQKHLEHPAHRCSVCQKRYVEEHSFREILKHFCLDDDSTQRLVMQVEVKFYKLDGCQSGHGGPPFHYFCPDHIPRPVRIWHETDKSNSGGFSWRMAKEKIYEMAEYKCPICKNRWSKVLRCVQKGEVGD